MQSKQIVFYRCPKPRPRRIICRRSRGVAYRSVPVVGMQHPRHLHLQILSFYRLKISENASARRGLGSAVNATSCFQVWTCLPRAEQVSFNLSDGWQRVKTRWRHVTWSSDAKTFFRFDTFRVQMYQNGKMLAKFLDKNWKDFSLRWHYNGFLGFYTVKLVIIITCLEITGNNLSYLVISHLMWSFEVKVLLWGGVCLFVFLKILSATFYLTGFTNLKMNPSFFSWACWRLLPGAVIDGQSKLAGPVFAALCQPWSGGPGASFQEGGGVESFWANFGLQCTRGRWQQSTKRTNSLLWSPCTDL